MMQVIFNDIARHMLTQMDVAKTFGDDGMCMYRAPNGMKCAFGAVIPDHVYDPESSRATASPSY